jgi:hypothetical protein
MEQREILSAISDTFTDKPKHEFTVPITNFTWLDRVLFRKKRKFVIYPCVVANSVRIAGRVVLLPDELKGAEVGTDITKIIHEHSADIVYIVACAIQNNRREPKQWLIDFISNNLSNEDLYLPLYYSIDAVGMQSFLNTIVLVRNITILKTSPLDESE